MESLSSLPLEGQIEALLAIAKRPVTFEEFIRWLEVSSEQPDRLAEVQAILQRFSVTDSGAEKTYWVPQDRQAEALERLAVDIGSVHRKIAHSALRSIGKLPRKSERGS